MTKDTGGGEVSKHIFKDKNQNIYRRSKSVYAEGGRIFDKDRCNAPFWLNRF